MLALLFVPHLLSLAIGEDHPTTQPAEAALEAPAAAAASVIPADPIQLAGAMALDDHQLSDVRAGDFEFGLEGFDISVSDNEAGLLTLDIAQNAFENARGLFTTLQAVNSAVNLNLIVNIYLNGLST
jgi:hypothetical protein